MMYLFEKGLLRWMKIINLSFAQRKITKKVSDHDKILFTPLKLG